TSSPSASRPPPRRAGPIEEWPAPVRSTGADHHHGANPGQQARVLRGVLATQDTSTVGSGFVRTARPAAPAVGMPGRGPNHDPSRAAAAGPAWSGPTATWLRSGLREV